MTVKQSIAGIIAAAAIGGGVYEGTVSEGPVNVVRNGELVGQRTATTVVYDRGGGQKVAHIYAKPIHWRDGNGWKTIDTAVREKPILRRLVSGRDYETTAGPYTADYETEKPYNYRMQANGASVAYTALFDTTKAVTVTVEPTTTGVKETIILTDKTAPTRLDWMVETDAVFTARGDGGFTADGLTIDPPIAWDANGKPVKVAASLEKGTYTLTVDTKGAVFPVTVDPTTRVTAEDIDALTGRLYNAQTTWAASRDGTAASTAASIQLGAGPYYDSGVAEYPNRSLYRFDTTSVPANAVIDSVVFRTQAVSSAAYRNWNLKICAAQDSLSTAWFNTSMYNEFIGWAASGAYSPTYLSDDTLSMLGVAQNDTVTARFNAAGKNIIAKGDTTQFFLLSSTDIADTPADSTRQMIFDDDNAYMIIYGWYDVYNTNETFDFPLASYKTHWATDGTYLTARDSVSPTTATADTIGQRTGYGVYRQTFYVPIPRTINEVVAASIVFTGAADESDTDFTITAVEGTWTVATTDEGRWLYANADTTNVYGTKSTSGFNAAGEDSLVFGADGRAAVLAASADTLFVTLISSRDMSETQPTGDEYVVINPANAALRVTWRLNSTEPTNMAITAVATDSVTVTWTDNSLDETGFDIVETLTGDIVTSVAADVTSVGVGGLLPNTLYSWRVQVDGGVYDDSLSVADSTYTYAAAPTAAPTLTFPDSVSAKVVLDTTGTGNPEWTEYAIQDSLSGLYWHWISGAKDTLRTLADWRTYGEWGGDDGDSLTVEVGKEYAFRVKARNDSLDSYSAMPTLLDAPLDSLTYTLADSTFDDNSQYDRTLQSARSAVSFSTLASGLKVMNFNGTTDLIDCGSALLGTGDITIEFWMRAETGGEVAGRILDSGTPTRLYINGTASITGSFTSTGATASTDNVFSADTWFHVMICVDNTTVTYYVNGSISGTPTTLDGSRTAGSTNLFIGNNSAGDRAFDGDIYGVRVYNGILTATQIYNRYIDTRDLYE